MASGLPPLGRQCGGGHRLATVAHLRGNLQCFLARLLWRDVAVQAQANPALPAGVLIAIAKAIGDRSARQPACDEAYRIVAGYDLSRLQRVDRGLTDFSS